MASSGQDPKHPSHSKQLPQDRQRPPRRAPRRASARRRTSSKSVHPVGRVEFGLRAAAVVAEVPEVEVVEARPGRAWVRPSCGRLPSQASIERAARLPWPDPDGHGALGRHGVAAGEDARRAGHQAVLVDLEHVAVEPMPGIAFRKSDVGLLAQRQDHGVGLSVSNRPVPSARPSSSSSMISTVSRRRPSNAEMVRSQLIRDAFGHRVLPPRTRAPASARWFAGRRSTSSAPSRRATRAASMAVLPPP